MELGRCPVRAIVRAVADAAARWADADFPPRVRVQPAIAERTGYSLPVVEYALDRLFESLDARAIEETIVSELGSLDALDRFVPARGGTSARALPRGRVCVLSSRTTIGVAIVPAVFALCAKCEVTIKDREDLLTRAFFETAAQELDAIGGAVSAQAWDAMAQPHDLRGFDVVVAFGSDTTLEKIHATLDARTHLVPYGSRASAGYVTREALAGDAAVRELAAGAARDLVLYDGQGCLSLHALFVERGGTIGVPAFVERFAREIERAAVEFPLGRRDQAAVAAVAAARDTAAFRHASGKGRVFSDAQATYLVVEDPPGELAPAFLPRAIGVHAVDGPDEATAYLRRHGVPIEAFALAGARADARDALVAYGTARIARFGTLQSPPLAEYHGGRPRIAEFVRWTGDET